MASPVLRYPSCPPGPKASGESFQASERHPGGEGERELAEPAAGRLQQGELLP